MNIAIRAESSADARALYTLVRAAFLNARHTRHTEQQIVTALREAGMLTLSLIGEQDGRIVGHVALSPVSIADGTEGWFGLGPLSVLPSHQRQGIGAKLAEEALRRLRASGARGCVVLGDPRFYGRFGFKADPRLWLVGVPPGYFQSIAFTVPGPHGSVRYHPAFDVST